MKTTHRLDHRPPTFQAAGVPPAALLMWFAVVVIAAMHQKQIPEGSGESPAMQQPCCGRSRNPNDFYKVATQIQISEHKLVHELCAPITSQTVFNGAQ